MPDPREVTRTEQRLAEVDALRQTIQQLKSELAAYTDALQQELQWLRREENVQFDEPPAAPVERGRLLQTDLVDAEAEVAEAAASMAEDEPDAEQVSRPIRNLTPQPRMRPAAPAPAPEPEPEESEEVEEQPYRGGKPVSVLISDGIGESEPMSGWILDRPPGGLRILVDEQIAIGSVLSVRPTKEHPHAQWVTISVKSCKPERNSFLLGCNFVERPPWTVLALFAG